MDITAKVVCSTKTESAASTALQFYPDYADGANAQWAASTPTLSLSMTVRGDVADQFEAGQHYTLTFTPDVAA
jgi:hypothetical protein